MAKQPIDIPCAWCFGGTFMAVHFMQDLDGTGPLTPLCVGHTICTEGLFIPLEEGLDAWMYEEED